MGIETMRRIDPLSTHKLEIVIKKYNNLLKVDCASSRYVCK